MHEVEIQICSHPLPHRLDSNFGVPNQLHRNRVLGKNQDIGLSRRVQQLLAPVSSVTSRVNR